MEVCLELLGTWLFSKKIYFCLFKYFVFHKHTFYICFHIHFLSHFKFRAMHSSFTCITQHHHDHMSRDKNRSCVIWYHLHLKTNAVDKEIHYTTERIWFLELLATQKLLFKGLRSVIFYFNYFKGRLLCSPRLHLFVKCRAGPWHRRHRQLPRAQNDWGVPHKRFLFFYFLFFPLVTIVRSYTHILSKMITDS